MSDIHWHDQYLAQLEEPDICIKCDEGSESLYVCSCGEDDEGDHYA